MIKKSESVILIGTLKSVLGMMVVLAGIQYLITGPGGHDYLTGLVIVALFVLMMFPIILTASFGSFIKLYRGEVSIGLPFDNYMQISIRLTALAFAGPVAGIFLFIAIKSLIGGSFWSVVHLLIFVLLTIPIAILVKSAFHKLLDPSNLPDEWDYNRARDIFYASSGISMLGFLCVALAIGIFYLLLWERSYAWAGILFIAMAVMLKIFRNRIFRVVERFDFPPEVELSLWMLF